MSIHAHESLRITSVTDDVLLIRQNDPAVPFSTCDGLLVLAKAGRNRRAVAFDLNIEPHLIDLVAGEYGPVGDCVVSHGIMDQVAHLHAWEDLGAVVHAPRPVAAHLSDLKAFYRGLGCDDSIGFSAFRAFAELCRYQPCGAVRDYRPGEVFRFDNLVVGTIPFKGRAPGCVGFTLVNERVFHIGGLGFDREGAEGDGFGPLYGFKGCMIPAYLRDIDLAREVYLAHSDLLTSISSGPVARPDITPFEYMAQKIMNNRARVEEAEEALSPSLKSAKKKLRALLEQDLFFQKDEMKGPLRDYCTHLEYWMIRHHMNA